MHRLLEQLGWARDDRSFDGCRIEGVPTDGRGDLIALTVGGNDLMDLGGRLRGDAGDLLRDRLEPFRARP